MLRPVLTHLRSAGAPHAGAPHAGSPHGGAPHGGAPHRVSKLLRIAFCAIMMFSLTACVSTPPERADNLCSIFSEKSRWYRSAKKSAARWQGSIPVAMAIIYQESSFKAKAKPPMQYFLWVIPTGRKSDAYGYSQALKSTWREYEKAVGSRFKDRDKFADAFDFVQWYMQRSRQRNGIAVDDAYAHYLNYHEGQGGYSRGTHRNKKWLLNVAEKVRSRANRYKQQLANCSRL